MFDYFTLNNLIQFIKIICNIAVVWVVFYFILKIVKNNARTIQIFKGILLVVIIRVLASMLGLTAVEYLIEYIFQFGPIAIIIIFQPEIRALLEKIGKSNVFSRISTLTLNERERLVDELVKACGEMSKTKTGALISLEQGHSLSDYIKTGTPMNSVVTSELLCSIFVPGTPLHDGAVILQGVKIACAAAYFPPTTQDLPTMYGARHRAAVGISEITDSITIIVSEETGNISIAEGGKLSVVSEKSLRDFLTMVICQTQTEVSKDKIKKDSDKDSQPKTQGTGEEKASRIPSIFRGKNKTEKKKGEKKKFTKAKKETVKSAEEQRLDDQVEKIGIANLLEESMPLDNLFDSIVAEAESAKNENAIEKTDAQEKGKKRKPKAKSEDGEESKPKKKTSKHITAQEAVSEEQPIVANHETKKEAKSKAKKAKKESSLADAASLLDDVISPEAIVLHYKNDKKNEEQETSLENPQEGSDE